MAQNRTYLFSRRSGGQKAKVCFIGPQWTWGQALPPSPPRPWGKKALLLASSHCQWLLAFPDGGRLTHVSASVVTWPSLLSVKSPSCLSLTGYL